jgi:plasmid stabilization system protein ParE
MRDSYRIEWLEPGKQDLRDIVFYLIDKAPLVAIGIQEEFDSQLSVLEQFPHISQENAYFDGVLDFKIKGLPYVVVYKVSPARRTVEILAVLHERKNRADSKNYPF